MLPDYPTTSFLSLKRRIRRHIRRLRRRRGFRAEPPPPIARDE
jgi:hypothetical protein